MTNLGGWTLVGKCQRCDKHVEKSPSGDFIGHDVACRNWRTGVLR